jgi:hypothetical protein
LFGGRWVTWLDPALKELGLWAKILSNAIIGGHLSKVGSNIEYTTKTDSFADNASAFITVFNEDLLLASPANPQTRGTLDLN